MPGLGEKFKRERERQKISLEEVAHSTKIGTRMLRAIEEEHFDQLPGGIFNKGFIRTYARQLRMNEEEAMTDYMAALGANQPQELPLPNPEMKKPKARPQHGPSIRIPWRELVAAVVLLALMFVLWNYHTRQPRPKVSPTPVATEVAPSVTVPPSPEPNITKPIIVPVSSTTTITDNSTARTFQVLIKAQEDSWIRITADGKGIEMTADTIPAQTEKLISAQKEVTIRAGNVGGLEFWFNGEKLRPQGEAEEVKTLTFHPTGLAPAIPQSPPSATH